MRDVKSLRNYVALVLDYIGNMQENSSLPGFLIQYLPCAVPCAL